MSEETEATIQAEESLLGAILIESAYAGNRDAINRARDIISPGNFYGYLPGKAINQQSQRARIFYAMVQSESPPHQVETARTLNQLGLLQTGDVALLCHLVSVCPCSLDFEDYAKAVKDYSLCRGGTRRPVYKGAI